MSNIDVGGACKGAAEHHLSDDAPKSHAQPGHSVPSSLSRNSGAIL